MDKSHCQSPPPTRPHANGGETYSTNIRLAKRMLLYSAFLSTVENQCSGRIQNKRQIECELTTFQGEVAMVLHCYLESGYGVYVTLPKQDDGSSVKVTIFNKRGRLGVYEDVAVRAIIGEMIGLVRSTKLADDIIRIIAFDEIPIDLNNQ